MTLLVKHKFSHYRRFEIDIWGVCFNDVRAKKVKKYTTEKELAVNVKSPYFKFFYKLWARKKAAWEARKKRYVYRLDMLPPDRPKKKFNQRFLSIRLTRLYFITLQDHQFRELMRRARKLDGSFEQNYITMIEGRVINLFYRTLFVASPFESIRFIKNGLVLLDFNVVKTLNIKPEIGKLLFPDFKLHTRIRGYLSKRLRGKAALFNVPKFLFVSFYLVVAIILSMPKRKDFVYPFSIDIQRITGYY